MAAHSLADAARTVRASTLPTTWIYFIREADGPVKIGVAKNPRERIATLQCGNPRPLEIVGVWRGYHFEERQLHERFEHLRLAGEWFEPTDELLAYIAAISDPAMVEEFSS